ncbi:MAG: hypothetical protein ACYTEZ_02940 [Planctomycetota bacterium]|jgi:hypothetical protein
MTTPFPERFLEQPTSCDVSAAGRMAVLDRGGQRLCLAGEGAAPVVHALDFRAIRVRFLGESLALLGPEGELLTLEPDGEKLGETRVRAGAVNLAVMRSGSVVVTYGRRGVQEHGITLERLGPTPLVHRDPVLLDATGLAVESGGFWLAGTGSAAPAARAVRLRPVPAGLSVRGVVALPAPPRSVTVGPDGALYVVLEPGESLVRVRGKAAGPVARLPDPVHELARGSQRLWSCGPRGLRDLTRLVPRPDAPSPIPLPPSPP